MTWLPRLQDKRLANNDLTMCRPSSTEHSPIRTSRFPADNTGQICGFLRECIVAQILNYWGSEGRRTQMTDTRLAGAPVQKVVVVNGNTEVLGMLETVLDAGRYDMVFVESSEHAYSQIKKVLPNLVILCTRIERLDGFQLLTMLKLDAQTRNIPVLTCTTEYEGQDFDTAVSQLAEEEEETIPARPALRMN